MDTILDLPYVWTRVKHFIKLVDYGSVMHPNSPFTSRQPSSIGMCMDTIPKDIQTVCHDIMVRATREGTMNEVQFCAYVTYLLLVDKCQFLQPSADLPLLLINYSTNLTNNFNIASFKYSTANFDKFLADHVYHRFYVAQFIKDYNELEKFYDPSKAFDADICYLP